MSDEIGILFPVLGAGKRTIASLSRAVKFRSFITGENYLKGVKTTLCIDIWLTIADVRRKVTKDVKTVRFICKQIEDSWIFARFSQ